MDADELLKWLGRITFAMLSVGGISAAAIQVFKVFSEKWLDARFATRLEQLRHAHSQELEDLRFKIATLLDRATKLHAREFEVLPEAWSKLNDAFWQATQFGSPFQSFPDLERTPEPEREAFLLKCRLTDWEREEVRSAKEKNTKYQELIFRHDYRAASEKYNASNSFLMKNGIFIEKSIRAQFQNLLDMIWNAIIETEVNHEIEHTERRRESTQALRSDGQKMLRRLETVIHERLWPANTASEPEKQPGAQTALNVD